MYIFKYSMLLVLLFSFQVSATELDVPECSYVSATKGSILLGIDGSDKPKLAYILGNQLIGYEGVTLCQVNSGDALNQAYPWAKFSNLEMYYGWWILLPIFLLVLASFLLLPKHWRSGVTLMGVVYLFGASWLFLSAVLIVLNDKHIPQRYLYDGVLVKLSTPKESWHEISTVSELDGLMQKNHVPFRQKKSQANNFIYASLNSAEDISENPQNLVIEYGLIQQKYLHGKRKVRLAKINPDGSLQEINTWFNAEDINFRVSPMDVKGKLFSPLQLLNIRKGPSKHYQRLTFVLTTKDQVKATGKCFGDWCEVAVKKYKSKGWVNRLWLKPL